MIGLSIFIIASALIAIPGVRGKIKSGAYTKKHFTAVIVAVL
jgi:hypothetical protein